MIQIEQLTKDYGTKRALNDVSFQIDKGEIVGLLGPNGAGKTTLMRIITGFIPATFGTVKVGDLDIDDHPKKVKKMIGYLPENCPLYPEMTVKDLLLSFAQLRGVDKKDLKQRLDYVLKAVKIEDKRDTIIGTLSKGYKQRVGLAQSLIHDPRILILDEPTVGLDPNQIIEIRELIKNLKGDRTIILSSHILSEISQTCEKIIIISDGKIAVEGTEEELINRHSDDNKVYVKVKGDNGQAVDLLNKMAGIKQININSQDVIELDISKENDLRPVIAKNLIENNFELLEMKSKKITLEEVFLRFTQE